MDNLRVDRKGTHVVAQSRGTKEQSRSDGLYQGLRHMTCLHHSLCPDSLHRVRLEQ